MNEEVVFIDKIIHCHESTTVDQLLNDVVQFKNQHTNIYAEVPHQNVVLNGFLRSKIGELCYEGNNFLHNNLSDDYTGWYFNVDWSNVKYM